MADVKAKPALRATTTAAVRQFVADVQAALTQVADAQRAPAMRAYMRDQFEFLGVMATPRREALRPLFRVKRSSDELLAYANALWRLPEREYHYAAVDLLRRQWKAFTLADIEAMLELAQKNSWWDTVDALSDVIGDIVRAARVDDSNAQRIMDAALKHENLWVRRIAMLHQLGWRDEVDAKRLFAYALNLAHEEDFFTRKAIGWALRDYAHHKPHAVREFLAQAGDKLSPLTRREANKHL